jgi:hypothetical protein
MVHPDRPYGNVTRRTRIAWWLPKATNKYSEYVILIAFPPQQWYPNATQCYTYSTVAVLSLPSRGMSASGHNKRVANYDRTPSRLIFQLNMYDPAAIQMYEYNSADVLPFRLQGRACKSFGTTLREVDRLLTYTCLRYEVNL